jgi:aspartate/methionine/tyrosine aminotransferase
MLVGQSMKLSKRGNIDSFVAMDVFRAANQLQLEGHSIIHMEVGQPADPAPAKVIEAAKRALDSHNIGYTEACGMAALQERIARFYADRHKVSISPAQVVVTTGSSAGFLLAFAAAFDPGDRVAIAAPGYPAYRNILAALNIEVVSIPVGPDTGWQLPVSSLQALDKPVEGVIIANPANPTGTMLDLEQIRAMASWCESHKVRLISDEIYHGIGFGKPAHTLCGMTRHGVVLNSFSKYFGMTGWRIGWMIAPPDMARAVECLQQNLFISAPTLSQIAAIAAFDCEDELDQRVQRYARNREILLDHLPKIGFDRLAPADGAFYLYADIAHLTDNSVEFCQQMLEQTGVATTPGIDFDPACGLQTIRFSYAGASDQILEAVKRLQGWDRLRHRHL